MRNRWGWRSRSAVAAALLLVGTIGLPPAGAFAGFTPALVSRAPDGLANGESTLPSADSNLPSQQSFGRVVSDDGRHVVFTSAASNLAPDTNGVTDVFVYNRSNGTTQAVSVGRNGVGTGASSMPSISGDGRIVVFRSAANDLVADDSNAGPDLFAHERRSGQTVLITRDSEGVPLGGASTFVLSRDGNTVVLVASTALTPNDSNGFPDVFAVDLRLAFAEQPAIELLSVNTAGVSGNGISSQPSVSDDGRLVAFRTGATTDDMVGIPDGTCSSGGVPGCGDVLLRDRAAGTTELLSISPSGASSIQNSVAMLPRISGDGRFVGFGIVSNQPQPVAGAGYWVRDVANQQNFIASPPGAGQTFMGDESTGVFFVARHAISQDGRFFVFETKDQNLFAPDDPARGGGTNDDIALFDRETGTTVLVSRNPTSGVSGNRPSRGPSISDDGRIISFTSAATDLLPVQGGFVERIYAYDTSTGELAVVSAGTAPSAGASTRSAVNGQGTMVAFQSDDANVVAKDSNGVTDIFATPIDPALRGIDPSAVLHNRGRQANATGHLACLAPHGQLTVTITQGATRGIGKTTFRCEQGTDALWSIPVRTHHPFAAGPARACASARYVSHSETIQEVRWCRDVTLV